MSLHSSFGFVPHALDSYSVVLFQAWGNKLNASPGWWPCANLHGHDGDSDDEDIKVCKKKLFAARRAAKILLEEHAREKDRYGLLGWFSGDKSGPLAPLRDRSSSSLSTV